MTKGELIKLLNQLEKEVDDGGDVEAAHVDADNLLLDFIDDPDIRDAFVDIKKWYS